MKSPRSIRTTHRRPAVVLDANIFGTLVEKERHLSLKPAPRNLGAGELDPVAAPSASRRVWQGGAPFNAVAVKVSFARAATPVAA